MIYFILLILFFVVILLIYMIKEAFENNVITQTFHFRSFPNNCDTLSIFFISDIHRRRIHPSIIENVREKVDLVIIGGDLLERRVPFERVEYNLSQLTRIAAVYFIWGNNDYEVDEQRLQALFDKYKIKILRNRTDIIWEQNNERIGLVGVDDISQEQEDLDQAVNEVSERDFLILVSHNPAIVHKMAQNDYRIPLVISGHTHGGQIHLLGYSPYKKGGIYKYPFTTQLISNGYGTSLVPLRLGARPETHIIRLKGNKK